MPSILLRGRHPNWTVEQIAGEIANDSAGIAASEFWLRYWSPLSYMPLSSTFRRLLVVSGYCVCAFDWRHYLDSASLKVVTAPPAVSAFEISSVYESTACYPMPANSLSDPRGLSES